MTRQFFGGPWALALGLVVLTGCASGPSATRPDASVAAGLPVSSAPVAEAKDSAPLLPLSALVPRVEPPVFPLVLDTAAVPDTDTAVPYRLVPDTLTEVERGGASWYGPRFHGRRTANGERFDMYALTAAHRTLPFGTIVRVHSVVTGHEIDVRINDRGPFAPGRIIDVSRAAAEGLGMLAIGVKEVVLSLPNDAAVPQATPAARGKPRAAKSKRSPKMRRPAAAVAR